ncbi:MAG: PepSY domain-containing protein [Thermoleophilaceae bacterium]|nr:PepSY domain-containing protein [Thermoleophilaceae bacterium]
MLVAAFAVSQTCQKSNVRLTKDQAIERAEGQVDFEPTNRQVRFLRQGLQSRPFWMVSLSIAGKQPGTFKKLAVVQINANTGKITKVEVQRNEP